ncbi:hypothetical protein [Gimesia fumaroli]|uniref:Uncharacterized protein n=1 Tax=Gimesia fumaroli TaxID=2527976 RepID=A0A518IFJ3_9PLAN|nr:hypothetical protein [Gimesia fumaroli]QDV51838.1 hypothetical protein Enr17x_38970 [Gimesia fumaroli]
MAARLVVFDVEFTPAMEPVSPFKWYLSLHVVSTGRHMDLPLHFCLIGRFLDHCWQTNSATEPLLEMPDHKSNEKMFLVNFAEI